MSEQPPQQPWAPPPGGYPYQPPPPTPSSATTALILGIVGLAVCPIVGIGAIVVGRSSMREIDESQGRLGGRSSAKAGFILGIISVAWVAVATFLVIAVFAVGGLWFSSVDCSSTDTGDSFSVHCD